MEIRRLDIADPTALVYHRRIRLVGTAGEVQGEIADGPHHFRVWIAHDGARVTDIRGDSVRHPWTTCPAAGLELRALIGMPLGGSSTAVGDHTAPTLQCTHMFDLAGLVIAHASRGATTRNYHCHVRQDENGIDHATCDRTDDTVPRSLSSQPLEPDPGDNERGTVSSVSLRWEVRGDEIVGPAPFEGVPLHRRFIAWAESNLDQETAEAAIVLRRACFVAPVRFVDVDQWERASELGNGAVCHTFQPERAPHALHMDGTYVDCGDDPERLFGE